MIKSHPPQSKTRSPRPDLQDRVLYVWVVIVCNLVLGIWNLDYLYADEDKVSPIIVNGDTVEYLTEGKSVSATGNVSVVYKGTTLTCNRLSVNIETKEGIAEGNARMEDQQGVVEGEKIIYNFSTKKGTIIDADFRSNPYFGRAQEMKKVSDLEFVAKRGYMSTCSMDRPHYRFKYRKTNFFPGDKVQIRDVVLYAGTAPIAYIPQYNHSLKEPFMHVQFSPGKSKDWGVYMLSAWRYQLAENLSGRIYFDYREKLGAAEGFGATYNDRGLGKGDFKYYYTQERSRKFKEGEPAEFQRYLVRWRHQWNIDEFNQLTAQYYKIVDSKRALYGSQYSFLKDYFPREYEKDSEPLSYALLHHSFTFSSLDITVQKRVNRWYTQEEKLPEITYSLPSYQIGRSPFYWQNTTSYLNYNSKNAVPSPSWEDTDYNKLDMTNKISMPMKAPVFYLTPFVSNRDTYYDKSTYGSTMQVNFSVGSDLSTKFYRIFNLKTDFLGLDINQLRHIITPLVNYTYSHTTISPSGDIRVGVSTDTSSNAFTLELSNKLQTKRENASVDLADFRINTTYAVDPKTGDKIGSHFSDFLFTLELRPYSWMTIEADTTYKRSGNDEDANPNYKHFDNANYDITFGFDEEHSFGIGQRYQRKGGNELTYNLKWRLTPKWKFTLYQRREFGHDPTITRGLKEQEYSITRDLHCWEVSVNYNIKKEEGEQIWVIFRLKAFPELEFEMNRQYHQPKPGSQSNP